MGVYASYLGSWTLRDGVGSHFGTWTRGVFRMLVKGLGCLQGVKTAAHMAKVLYMWDVLLAPKDFVCVQTEDGSIQSLRIEMSLDCNLGVQEFRLKRQGLFDMTAQVGPNTMPTVVVADQRCLGPRG